MERLPRCKEGHLPALSTFKIQRLNLSIWGKIRDIPPPEFPSFLQRGCFIITSPPNHRGRRERQAREKRRTQLLDKKGSPFQRSGRKATALTSSQSAEESGTRDVSTGCRSLVHHGILQTWWFVGLVSRWLQMRIIFPKGAFSCILIFPFGSFKYKQVR